MHLRQQGGKGLVSSWKFSRAEFEPPLAFCIKFSAKHTDLLSTETLHVLARYQYNFAKSLKLLSNSLVAEAALRNRAKMVISGFGLELLANGGEVNSL